VLEAGFVVAGGGLQPSMYTEHFITTANMSHTGPTQIPSRYTSYMYPKIHRPLSGCYFSPFALKTN
jgi:hypothetical protein